MRIPPQNRLEALKGDRKGQWSIRVNDQWHVCFTWKDGAAWDVEIIAGKRSITADTAARLSVYFGMKAEFWLNLQAHYDLALTREALAENLAAAA